MLTTKISSVPLIFCTPLHYLSYFPLLYSVPVLPPSIFISNVLIPLDWFIFICDQAQQKGVKCSNNVSETWRFWNISCFQVTFLKHFIFCMSRFWTISCFELHISEIYFHLLKFVLLKHSIFWTLHFGNVCHLWTSFFGKHPFVVPGHIHCISPKYLIL